MLRVRETGCDSLMHPTYAPFLSGTLLGANMGWIGTVPFPDTLSPPY